MSESRRPPRPAARTRWSPKLLCFAGIAIGGMAVAGTGFAATMPATPPASQAPSKRASAQPPAAPLPAPRLRSAAAFSGSAASDAAVRLMVFSLQQQRVFDALTVVQPLLSERGSVELDPKNNTIAVRDDPAALARVATAIRAFDRENQRVRIDVQLIHAETAKISPVRPAIGIAPDLLDRLRQLLRFQTFSLLAHSQIESREGESVVYEMAQGYRLSFALGTVIEGRRVRLSGFRFARLLPGQPENELVHTVVYLGADQPLILGLTKDEGSDKALMLVLRYQAGAAGS